MLPYQEWNELLQLCDSCKYGSFSAAPPAQGRENCYLTTVFPIDPRSTTSRPRRKKSRNGLSGSAAYLVYNINRMEIMRLIRLSVYPDVHIVLEHKWSKLAAVRFIVVTNIVFSTENL